MRCLLGVFFFSSRRRHTRWTGDWSSDVCSSDLYSALVVPGLLQTVDYARAVLGAIRLDLEEDEIERRVDLRKSRQSLLARERSRTRWVVLDEAVLRRVVGGPEVMRAQLQRLM